MLYPRRHQKKKKKVNSKIETDDLLEKEIKNEKQKEIKMKKNEKLKKNDKNEEIEKNEEKDEKYDDLEFDFKISSWNVNGLRAALKSLELQKYIEKEDPDVLFLGETKIDDSLINDMSVSFPRHRCYWNCCKTKKGYSGVACISKAEPVSVRMGMGIKEHDQEGRLIAAEFENFTVVNT
eukprot:GHVL01037006.1.p1 GENE.GHVL01037006.1~~GHVL01037006.1.p1  ORF type:complete len:179 (-),score=61.30 GHVL01037006.1:853-1389(-)